MNPLWLSAALNVVLALVAIGMALRDNRPQHRRKCEVCGFSVAASEPDIAERLLEMHTDGHS